MNYKKSSFLAVISLFCCSAYSDRLLSIPTGGTLEPKEIKIEYVFQPDDPHTNYIWAQYSIDPKLEIQEIFFQSDGINRNFFNMQFHVVPVLPGIVPGITVGVQDLFNQSKNGAGFYLVATEHVLIDKNNSKGRDFIIHVGVGAQGIGGVFMGFELPLSNNITFIAEHNTRSLNSAIEFAPLSQLRFRAYLLDGRAHLGVTARVHF